MCSTGTNLVLFEVPIKANNILSHLIKFSRLINISLKSRWLPYLDPCLSLICVVWIEGLSYPHCENVISKQAPYMGWVLIHPSSLRETFKEWVVPSFRHNLKVEEVNPLIRPSSLGDSINTIASSYVPSKNMMIWNLTLWGSVKLWFGIWIKLNNSLILFFWRS